MMAIFRFTPNAQLNTGCPSSQTNKYLLLFISFILLFLSSFSVLAQQNEAIELKLIANLQHENISNTPWIDIVANPRNKQQYYVANGQGQLYLVDQQEIQLPAVFDLAAIEKLTGADDDLALTAIALHPNFAFREQPGFATFYTAHVSKIANSSKTSRLEDKEFREHYRYDAVLTEWQLNPVSLKNTELASQRELLRISLLNKENHINQIDFNPYSKSWNDNYGLLYFSLKTEEQLQQSPLYSGTVFRINPTKFGRKAYTNPASNPFIKNNDIADEIFVLGAQQIENFIWPEKNSDHLLLSHYSYGKHLLSLSGQKNDWRLATVKRVSISNLAEQAVLMYQGRELFELRNSLLFLSKTNNQWQLNSLNYDTSIKTLSANKNQAPKNLTIEVWPMNNDILPQTAQLSLFVGQANELIFIDQNTHYLYGFEAIKNVSSSPENTPEFIAQESSLGKVIFLAFVMLFIIVVIYFLLKTRKNLFTNKLGKNFSRFELSQSKKQVGLYLNRQTTTETVITLTDLLISEIHLNGSVITSINHHSVNGKGHGFSEEQETDLRQYFSDEHKDKMVDNKTRQISLVLTDHKQQYVVTLYLRKGNQRLTKLRYKEVLEDLIDWCWLISKTINAENTGKRVIKVVNTADKTLEQQAKSVAKLKASPVKQQIKPTAVPLTTEIPIHNQDDNKPRAKTDKSLIDTELVNALEKLVKLRQQGFLTDEEFTLAKHRLLDDLIK